MGKIRPSGVLRRAVGYRNASRRPGTPGLGGSQPSAKLASSERRASPCGRLAAGMTVDKRHAHHLILGQEHIFWLLAVPDLGAHSLAS